METTHGAARSPFHIDIGKSLSNSSFVFTGGKAEYYAEPENTAELQGILEEAYRRNLPVTVIADGTHVIISDEGIEGLLISTRKLRGMTIKGNLVTAYAGEPLSDVINFSIDHNLTGLEELGGIPGTIAAAIRQNASFQGKFLSDSYFYADYMSMDGKLHRHPDFHKLFGCDTSPFQDDEIIISVTLNLKPCRRSAECRVKKEKYVELQFIPPAQNFVGKVFKAPVGETARSVIRRAGLTGNLGFKAEFSPYESNCIFAYPNCTAKEMKELIEYVQAEAYRRTGIKLEILVSFLGRFN